MRVSALLEFFEPSIGVDWNLQPTQAFEYLRAKGLRATFSYADMLGEEHAAAFTVAKMLDTDLLADVKASLEDALSTGKSYRQWADELVPLLQSKGWWGRAPVVDPLTGQTVVAQLGSPHRLQTIFRTNMQSAYSVGHWEQIADQQDEAPFLMYDAIDDFRTRPEHAALDGKIHAVGSGFWEHYYPPNGWNCRCSVIQLSADELDELGLEPSAPFRLQTEAWENPRTGKIERVAKGVDPGFDFNPGQKRLESLGQLAIEKVRALPDDAAAAAAKKLAAPEPPPVPAYPIPAYTAQTTVAAAERLAEEIVNAPGPASYVVERDGLPAVRFSHVGVKGRVRTIAAKYGKASYKGLDVETCNFVNAWLASAQDLCDKLKIPRLRGVNTAAGSRARASMGDGILALAKYNTVTPATGALLENIRQRVEKANQWKAADGNTVISNGIKFRGKQVSSRDLSDRPSVASDYFVGRDQSLLATLWHELAHHIHQQLSVIDPASYEFPPLERFLATFLKARAADGSIVFPTQYATKNSKEYFAECFALYKMGRPELVPEYMIEIFAAIERGEMPR